MHSFKYSILLLIALGLCACTENTPEFLEDTAQGVLVVDGKRTLIEHVYTVGYNDNNLLIILTDKPVEQHLIPDGIDNLAKAGKLIGMVT